MYGYKLLERVLKEQCNLTDDKDNPVELKKPKEKEFKDRYWWRAGVETTMSEYDRRTGVKQLRVRGLKTVRFSATLKALGVNIFRAAVVRAVKIMPEQSLCAA